MENGKIVMKINYKLLKISGDASFRLFYRIIRYNKSSILVFAKKEQFKNLIVYSVVNKILNSHNILSPKLLKNYYKDNMIEISDLGDKSFYDYIKNKKDKSKDYKKLIELIIKLQKIKLKNKYYFSGKKIKFTKYSLSNLHKESDLFFDWHLKYCTRNLRIGKIKKYLKKSLIIFIKNFILKTIILHIEIFMHQTL